MKNDKYHEDIHELERFRQSQGRPFPSPSRDPVTIKFILLYQIFMAVYDSFGSVDDMRIFVESLGDRKQSFLDLDWIGLDMNNQNYWKQMLIVIMSARPHNADKHSSYVTEFLTVSSCLKNRFFKIYRVQNAPNQEFVKKVLYQISIGTSPTLSLVGPNLNWISAIFTHPVMRELTFCCDGNLIAYIQNRKEEMYWMVLHPISAGEKLTLSVRQTYFQDEPSNKCSNVGCIPCQEGWKDMIDSQKMLSGGMILRNFFKNASNDPKKVTSSLSLLRELFKFINRNFEGYNSDSKVRQRIASKKSVIYDILVNMIGSTYQAQNQLLTEQVTSRSTPQMEQRISLDSIPAVGDE